MTQALQLLVIAGTLVGLVVYGFVRDKQEHRPKADAETKQQSIYFPEPASDTETRRGAAMSQL